MEQKMQCDKCSWYARVRCLGEVRGPLFSPGMFGCVNFRRYHSRMTELEEWDQNFWAKKLEEKMLEKAINRFEAEEADREVPRWMAGR